MSSDSPSLAPIIKAISLVPLIARVFIFVASSSEDSCLPSMQSAILKPLDCDTAPYAALMVSSFI